MKMELVVQAQKIAKQIEELETTLEMLQSGSRLSFNFVVGGTIIVSHNWRERLYDGIKQLAVVEIKHELLALWVELEKL